MRESFRWSDLDTFTQAYIEALFFTSSGGKDDSIPADKGFSDLAPETLRTIMADCASFQDGAGASDWRDTSGRTRLDLAYDYATADYGPAQAGHDFWMTRNGHGVGFWGRGLGDIGGLTHAYLGDNGLVYVT